MSEPIQNTLKRKESSQATERRWLDKEIKPVSVDEVNELMTRMYEGTKALPEFSYTVIRGVKALIGDTSRDYAKLPDVGGVPFEKVLTLAPKGAEWIDIACGSGTFIQEVLESVNPEIIATGFDARIWRVKCEIPELVLGNVDNIQLGMFPNHPKGFDIITSAALLYHLPDYWGVLGKSVNLLKPGGAFSISTLNRPLDKHDNPIDDQEGQFKVNPEIGETIYHENNNIFGVDGQLVSMADALNVLNTSNLGFRIDYKLCNPSIQSHGNSSYGAGLSGRRIGAEPIDLSNLFYCYYPKGDYERKGLGDRDLSFILAKSPDEIATLKSEGFQSVQDRIY